MTRRAFRAVVPAKSLSGVKTRLASVLEPEERRLLFAAMLADVLDAVAAVDALSPALVVTRDPEVGALAVSHEAVTLHQESDEGHTVAVIAGGKRLIDDGARAMLTVPGDVPMVTPSELRRLIAAHSPDRPGMTIAPSHDRMGSNAIVMSPPDAVPLAFGDDSFLPHLRAARGRGIAPDIVECPGLARDVDTPEDLGALVAELPGGATGDAIRRLGLAARLKSP